jgi:hypothetical protein
VFLIFALVVFEGAIAVAFLVAQSPPLFGDWLLFQDVKDEASSLFEFSSDPSSRSLISLTSTIKNASEGSDYSRRVIARLLLSILARERGVRFRSIENGEDDDIDIDLERSLAAIVYPYSPDRGYQSRTLSTVGRAKVVTKEEYLRNLDDILARLGGGRKITT